MKDFELDKLSDELYADASGLDPELEWKEEAVTESPIEEASVERIGDFMVRNGNEAVEYVGTSTVVVIPEGITKIDSFFLEGKLLPRYIFRPRLQKYPARRFSKPPI